MFKRILNLLSKIIIYFFQEIIIKYLICYIIAVLGYIIAVKSSSTHFQVIILNISSSLISLPIVFIVYDLYSLLLMHKSTKLIYEEVDKEISNIFLKFIYFSTHFYNEFNPKSDKPYADLNEVLNYNKDQIFGYISENKHHGYFIFSSFDNFDENIEEVLSSNRISKYLKTKEISKLQEFSNDYRKFKQSFSFISDNDFIQCNKIENTAIDKSKFIVSLDTDDVFYDIKYMGEVINPYYSAKYAIFDQNTLLYKYKLSGNKAKELAHLIYKLYEDINKWKKLRFISKLNFDNALVSLGRLYLDDNLVINAHMDNAVVVRGLFK